MSLTTVETRNLLAASRIDNVTPSLRKLLNTIKRCAKKSSLKQKQKA
ncbi:MAG TPA: hypothetical protein VMX35_09175 [Acidobacteriota bacterium]|nr:hypothetical protein [Acidobacteriota bacterium]